MIACVGVALVTIACLAADGALILAGSRAMRGGEFSPLRRWTGSLGTLMAGLSLVLVVVVWQRLPALLG